MKSRFEYYNRQFDLFSIHVNLDSIIKMRIPLILMRLLILVPLFHFSSSGFSQNCIVQKEAINVNYSGDCKKGKAHGKGKAVGVDTYEGEFKNGLPDGQGFYIWDNGDNYSGHFVKGLREGKGTMRYKKENASDSIVDGYWKKDAYVGKNEHPYIIHFKSKLIIELEVDYKKEFFNEVTFFVTNTSSGSTSISGVAPKLKVDDIQMNKGAYGKMTNNYNHYKKTETILTNVIFSARMKVIMDSEELDIEFIEPGRYVLNIRINK